MIVTLALSLMLRWAMYERKPEIGEFLYFEQNDTGLFVHPIKDASFNIYKERDKHFLTLQCNASPPESGDKFDANSMPHLEVSIMFDADPKTKISEGVRIPAKPYDDIYHHITVCRYTSIWGNLHEGIVTINKIADNELDVTIVGNDSDSDLGRIAVRARFQHVSGLRCDFY